MHMKIFICLFATLVQLKPSAPAQQIRSAIDVQRYVFNIEVNDHNDSITCLAIIHFNIIENTDNVSLDLISKRVDGKGMTVYSVTENDKPLSYTHTNNIVRINLTAVAGSTEKTIQIAYRGIPADGLIISKNKYNHRTFFADNWPNRARNWLPCVDHPSDKAGIEFRVIAPAHYQVIANGLQVEETNLDKQRKLTHYKESVALPMKVTAIGIADFAVQYAGETSNIPIYSWTYPEDRDKGFYDYALATEILPFFIQNIGPYAYKKLANVQSKTTFGGLENAGAIFYAETSVKGNRSMEELIAHEIAHQWFGNMATEGDWAHLWLSEGFATYMSILYMENKYGKDTAQKMRMADRTQVIAFSKQKISPVVDSSTTNYVELLNANSYQKGGWILHMLRKQLGDAVFWNGIRSYYGQYAGKNVLTDDLRRTMEKVSGTDLKQFFQQWLHTPGHPVLDIQWKYNAASTLFSVNINQQQTLPFAFPLEINVMISGNRSITKTIMIKDKLTSLSMPLVTRPVEILIDPVANLLYEGMVKENR